MKTVTAEEELRAFLKRWLRKHTGCTLQHDGWCCNTDFFCLMKTMGVPDCLQQGFWSMVLWTRGDYKNFDFKAAEIERTMELIRAGVKKKNGTKTRKSMDA